jgi:8-oxo-dGTP pyrophosphatase MutT (NUDIX family)
VPEVEELLADYQPENEAERADVQRIRAMVAGAADPWSRSTPLHITASAVIVHPDTGRVLLRWHQRQRAWLQAGGHGDPGESDPLAVALREAEEESGLTDLKAWPDGRLWHAVIVNVTASATEPAHHHADLRFVLATDTPEAARPEKPDAPLRWLTLAQAEELTAADNLRETLRRMAPLLTR